MKNAFLLFALAPVFILFGCNQEAGSAGGKVMLSEISLPKEKSYDKKEEVSRNKPAPKNIESSAKIIKKANLKFETQDLAKTFGAIQNAAQKYGAVIANDSSGKDFAASYRNLLIRIPNANFDIFINDISKGVSHFDEKQISQEDVTEEYIDVESRMKSKKKLEERYIQLLNKANKVSEMLEIEGKLAEIREEIEAKEGQLKYLQNRISLSTISIEMYTIDPSESGATSSYGSKIWNSIKEGFNGLSNFMLSIISIWPFILIFVGVYLWARKRFLKKRNKS
ncbi:DUF4349 domain-containing protein [Flavobacterium sp. H122]|uniref:DUF4349 domain-containing protein n=1 Tax=Flavobacterium sp. H122 TaxID=2529860 RepID=UPI0010AA4F7A|nr:DUF4349 domain-containing protein [Flavobacterium sp. H122]